MALIAAMPDGPSAPAGKNFRPDAPAASACSASVGVKTPGMVTMPRARAAPMTAGSTFGLTHQPTAGICDAAAIGLCQHRARPDQAARAVTRGKLIDRAQGVGGIERHLDRLEAFLDQRVADRLDLARPDAAQDGDQIAGEFRPARFGMRVQTGVLSIESSPARIAPMAAVTR